MTAEDKAEFYLTMDSLAEVFNVEISNARKRAYFAAMEDIPLDAVQAGCAEAVRLEKFFPVPAILREFAGFPMVRLPQAEAAWYRLRNLETRYNRQALQDPITRMVFDAMGGGYALEWGFGNWPLEKEDRKHHEFLSRYREAQRTTALAAQRPERTRRILLETMEEPHP